MAVNREKSADRPTFSQRYGYDPLPEPMKIEHISDTLRREIFNNVRRLFLEKEEIAVSVSKDFLGETEDEIDEQIRRINTFGFLSNIQTNKFLFQEKFKNIIIDGKFNSVLDLVEIIVNHRSVPKTFVQRVKNLFEEYAAAYWLNTSQQPFQFIPRSSKEQGETVQKAIETNREAGMKGASTHLRKAAAKINKRQFPESVRDSIDAVESVARRIDPKASETLGPALNSLEDAGLLKHPDLKEALRKLYHYTCDEQGIRHALLDKDAPDVGLEEAIFMFGACASFAAYLVNKHRQQAEKQGDDG